MKTKTVYDLICALRAAGLWDALTAESNWANIKDCQLFVYEYVQTHEKTRRRGYRRRVCHSDAVYHYLLRGGYRGIDENFVKHAISAIEKPVYCDF